MIDVLTARQLATELDGGRPLTLIDTRPTASYESWRVPGAVSFPFGPTEALTDERRTALEALADLDRPIRTICGKGVTSANLAVRLDRAGYTDVAAVSGGMRDWNELYETAAWTPREGLVVVQFGRRGKGCLSYLVADERVGEAVVIDPGRHLDRYLTAAGERGLAITAVLDTHVHADHISGGRALADRLGVPYRLGAGAGERDVAVEYDPLADGEAVPVGDATLEAMETPGHTSELVSYRLGDHAVFTGDALFVDSLGRTELQFGEAGAADGARMAYHTLHERFGRLPSGLTVLPGHVHVEPDGTWATGRPGTLVAATLGDVLDGLALYGLDEPAFVDRVTSDLPEKPANYERVIRINRGVDEAADETEAISLETGRNNCAV